MVAVLATTLMIAVLLTGCGMSVPPVPHGPQTWSRGEPYRTLYHATLLACAKGKWLAATPVKLDRENMSNAQMEELVKSGYNIWTGQFDGQAKGIKPTSVKNINIAPATFPAKTHDAKGTEIQLQCLRTVGTGITVVERKKDPQAQGAWANFFALRQKIHQEVVITACAKTTEKRRAGWILDHIKVEELKKDKGGN